MRGNILQAYVDAIVNPVNCVGIMGAGLALQFREAYPENYIAYKVVCANEVLSPGTVFVYTTGKLYQPKYVINFPTKQHWKDKSLLSDIILGLSALKQEILSRKIKSIAIPPLGCGLGGLDWGEVRLFIEASFVELPHVRVLLYEPFCEKDDK